MSVDFTITGNGWGSGFEAEFKFTNTSQKVIDGWEIEFDSVHNITSLWNGDFTKTNNEKDGSYHYVVKNPAWKSKVAPGETIKFGFNANSAPNFPVNGDLNSDNFTNLSFDGELTNTSNSGGNPDLNSGINSSGNPDGNSGSNSNGNSNGNSQSNSGENSNENSNINPVQGAPSQPTISIQDDNPKDDSFTITLNKWYGTSGNKWSVKEDGKVIYTADLAPTSNSEPQSASFNLTGRDYGVHKYEVVLENDKGQTISKPLVHKFGGASTLGIEGLDTENQALQLTIDQGTSEFTVDNLVADGSQYSVKTNNPDLIKATIDDQGKLTIAAEDSGRGAIRIEDTTTGETRYLGVRVKTQDGKIPGMPDTLAIGSVSEDSKADLGFWQDFGDGLSNKRMDARYIYLNGGPENGWRSWQDGQRLESYLRESQKLGMVPYFVYYNIPDGGESYFTDKQHIESQDYLESYAKDLKYALDTISDMAGDDPVGMVLEPDFIGYMAQNSGQRPQDIFARTDAFYSSGVLDKQKDPSFENNLTGLVKAINYTISKNAPNVNFGWQFNLWASPAGGFTGVGIPSNGLVRITDKLGIDKGRQAIIDEGKEIAKYYKDAGILSYGADFISIDKYGLDAAGVTASAAQDPEGSAWFWNNDHWNNYLLLTKTLHQETNKPVTLWQIPVGHINGSQAPNPYDPSGKFKDLANDSTHYEDSAGTFFLGDTFIENDPKRLKYFSQNQGKDPGLSVDGNKVTWSPHIEEAKEAGINTILFGAGVGSSTDGVGSPPTDGYWWISQVQEYYQNPVSLDGTGLAFGSTTVDVNSPVTEGQNNNDVLGLTPPSFGDSKNPIADISKEEQSLSTDVIKPQEGTTDSTNSNGGLDNNNSANNQNHSNFEQNNKENTTSKGTFNDFLEALGEYESGKPSGDPGQYSVSNPFGVSGKYQIDPDHLYEIGYIDKLSTNKNRPWDVQWSAKAQKYGVNSYQDYLTSPEMQEAAIRDSFKFTWGKVSELLEQQGKSINDYLGKTVTYVDRQGNTQPVTLTASGILYGAHSQGAWGMGAFLINLQDSYPNYNDVLRTIGKFSGYDVPESAINKGTSTPIDPISADPVALDSTLTDTTAGGGVEDNSGGGDRSEKPPGSDQANNQNNNQPLGKPDYIGVNGKKDIFNFTWDWGSQHVIDKFNPSEDSINLKNFWTDYKSFKIYNDTQGNAVIDLKQLNNQTITLKGVSVSELSPDNITGVGGQSPLDGNPGNGNPGNGNPGNGNSGTDNPGTDNPGPGGVPKPTDPMLPTLSVKDLSIQEGNSGSKNAIFNVNLSEVFEKPVSVKYATVDVSAKAGQDYEKTTGTLNFDAGQTSQTISVAVKGDTQVESNEKFSLQLSDLKNATFINSKATVTILNDDRIPTGGNSGGTGDNQGGKKGSVVAAYYPEWGTYQRDYQVSDIPADKLTHAFYAFAKINDNGEVDLFDKYAAIEKGKDWNNPDKIAGNFGQMAQLKAENSHLKTIISIGGWTLSSKFSDVALTDASRKKFATSAVDFMKEYGFDGIDIDWEYPVGGGKSGNINRPEDKHNYTLLLEELDKQIQVQEAQDNKDYLLTIASPAGFDKTENYELAEMSQHLDWFNVMTYDYHGAWEKTTNHNAALYANSNDPSALADKYNVDSTIQNYLNAGVSPDKIVMGAPLYGRTWQGVSSNNDGGLFQSATGAGPGSWENGMIDYKDLHNKLETDKSYVRYWDDQAKVPYVYNAQKGFFSTYEDTQSLGHKLDYVQDNSLGGMFFWDASGDLAGNNSDSLINLAATQLGTVHNSV
ncbi:MAG: glycosyl hydrolase family 18 protein [Mastigocoleus sp. MO_167.B18]|nr:glycosyl hydrolase family 18 protein [Mastigocoleus sp. MO_167.B18]